MRITVKLSNGTTKDVELDSLEISLDDLKGKLAELVGIPAENQRIVFRGRVLKPTDTLRSAGVEDGHAVHVVRSQSTPAPVQPVPSTPTPAPAPAPSQVPVTSQPDSSTLAVNPYAALFSGAATSQPTPASADNTWAASGFGAGWTPSVQEAQQMMQNPMVMQMVQQMMQNPQFVQQVTASNPLLQSLPPEVVRQSISMMNNPQMMQQMSQMMGGGMGMGGMAPRSGDLPSGNQSHPMFSPPPVQNPREAFATQLEQLRSMGFPNEQANIAALQQSQGNIEFAIERLLGS